MFSRANRGLLSLSDGYLSLLLQLLYRLVYSVCAYSQSVTQANQDAFYLYYVFMRTSPFFRIRFLYYGCSSIQFTTSACPFLSASARHFVESHGQSFCLAHFKTCKCPFMAEFEVTKSFSATLCSSTQY